MPGAHGGQERVSDALGLELQMVVNHFVGSGTGIGVPLVLVRDNFFVC